MKRTTIILLILLFTVAFETFSNPVDAEMAKIVAQNFMNIRRNTSNTVSDVVIEKREGQNTFYVVNFREGGWVMVSADDVTAPVFAFNLDGVYRVDDEKPDAFLDLVFGYKEQVTVAQKIKSMRSNEVIESWNGLINVDKDKKAAISQKTYTTGISLLNVPGRGYASWGQGTNNNSGCNPSYNAYAPTEGGLVGLFNDCDCEKAPVGCGAVAMGQVMWYWQWPKSSQYRTYNWNLMPNALFNGQTAQGEEIAHLLRDCGLAVNIAYFCNGSSTTLNNIEEGLRNKFNFNAARKVDKADWNSSVWNDLIRSEIDCERPVIYRGDESGLISLEKHIFVIDGYFTIPNFIFFHINFGWKGFSTWHVLSDISGTAPSGDEYEYGKNQGAIIGISPTYYSPGNVNVTGVPYTTVTGSKTEEAQQNISLPASGNNLTVENGGNLTLVAGNSITLGPGFHAKPGSQFTAKIDESYSIGGDMGISVPGWPNAMSPERGGFWIWVTNANSYDITITRRSGHTIYQGAGIISGNRVDLWDGSGADPGDGVYVYRLRLRNNFGRIIDRTSDVTLIHTRAKSAGAIDSAGISTDFAFSDHFTENTAISESDVVVYPNPNSGTVYINIAKPFSAYSLKVYNVSGVLVRQAPEITEPEYSFDMSRFADGTYLLQMEIDRTPVSKKIILAR